MLQERYITTPIYYVNDRPHIGHAYTSIAADILARYMRLSNYKVKFLTGTDEHGQKIQKSAEKAGLLPKDFIDQILPHFKNLINILNISNDDFIRTTESRHSTAVQHLWNTLASNGNIYLSKYAGWYSIRDEAFYNENELTPEGLAPTGAPVEWIEEESYFFALSKWQDKLLEFYKNNPEFIKPKHCYNEIINFVTSGLHDLSISRCSITWGIKVPHNPEHIVYVWLDALTNYLSAAGYPNTKSTEYQNFWPPYVHIIGKDILKFHAIYWPAFLMAANLPLPRTIVAHGWWTNQGQKMSKSIGNTIDPLMLAEKFGADQIRYFLMREITFGSDGNFVLENLVNRINSELVNKIGNLVHRSLVFIQRHMSAKVPSIEDLNHNDELLVQAECLQEKCTLMIENFNFNAILNEIISLVEEANRYIDKHAPWQLIITDPKKTHEVLYIILETIRYIGILLQPFIPNSASKILDQLGIHDNQRNFSYLSPEYALKPNAPLPNPTIIFAKIT